MQKTRLFVFDIVHPHYYLIRTGTTEHKKNMGSCIMTVKSLRIANGLVFYLCGSVFRASSYRHRKKFEAFDDRMINGRPIDTTGQFGRKIWLLEGILADILYFIFCCKLQIF